MLCDRTSTNVAGAQPGFVNFVTLPIFNPFAKIFPVMAECVDQLKANAVTWKTYVETEEDKKVYIEYYILHIYIDIQYGIFLFFLIRQ